MSVKGVNKENIRKYALNEFLTEYKILNADNKYRPVAVGRYGIRKRESIYSKELAKDYSKNKLIYKNTLTVGMGSKQIDIGILTEDEVFAVSPAYHTYEIQGIRCKYLEYCLRSKNIEMFSLYAKRGSRQGKSIDLKRWLTYKIPVYSEEDQIVIEDNLNKINVVIELRRKQLELLDELVRARFVEMFGDVQDAKKRGGQQLKDICNTVAGGTPSTKHVEYYNGTIPWISTVSLGPNYIDGTTAKAFITQEAVDSSSTKIIPSGSILFGTRVGVGKSSINQVEMCTNQDIVAIIDLDVSKYNKLYIKYVLDTYQPYFDSIKKGATILGISSDDLKNIYVPDASLYEQNRFEKFVKQIDKSRSRIQKSLEASQELFDSLMQEYFG